MRTCAVWVREVKGGGRAGNDICCLTRMDCMTDVPGVHPESHRAALKVKGQLPTRLVTQPRLQEANQLQTAVDNLRGNC